MTRYSTCSLVDLADDCTENGIIPRRHGYVIDDVIVGLCLSCVFTSLFSLYDHI